jgi:Cu/Ag efflux protein CusF
MRITYWVLLLAGLFIAFAQPAMAEDFAKGTTVRHVDYAKNKITLELYRPGEGERMVKTYTMDPAPTITLDGSTVTLKAIKRGMHVTGIIESDPGTIVTLTVQTY